MQGNDIDKHTPAEGVMEDMRRLFMAVAKARLALLEMGRWACAQGLELELAAEEIEEAVRSLCGAEDAISNAHRHVMAAQAVEASRY